MGLEELLKEIFGGAMGQRPPDGQSAAETKAEDGDWSLEEVDVRKRDDVDSTPGENRRADERAARKRRPAGVKTEEEDWSIE